jgi:iron complex transport system substrate-binding protein
VTEILFAVGAGEKVVGVTSFCDFPPAAKTVPKIGDFRTSLEKVVAREPDLVVASVSANGQAIRDVERMRIPVFAIDTRTVKQVFAAIRGIGEITGNARGALGLVKSMNAAMSAVEKRVRGILDKPRTLIVVDVNTPWVAGANTYMDDLVTMAGGINIARDVGSGWRPYSPEKVVVKRPEVILVTDSNHLRLRTFPGWSRVPACVNDRLHGNLPISIVRPGPRLPEALRHIARLLHPNLFQPRQ